MADAVVGRRQIVRFFCHRCLVEFEDDMEDFLCPYCEGGFVEQLEDGGSLTLSGDDYSDADMSNIEDMSNLDDMNNLDDSTEVRRVRNSPFNDLAFLMSGSRIRGASSNPANGASGASGAAGTGRRPTLMEELVWMIGGGRPIVGGAMTAGAPFVLVGTPGDYVFGGDGLDAVVTQLLGQLEHSGPPPLNRDRLDALPSEEVTEEQASSNTSCSVCWENYQLGETTSRLECDHVFHKSCIVPWLQLHATCPICRRSLQPPEEATSTTAPTTTTTTTTTTASSPSTPSTTTASTQAGATLADGQIRIGPATATITEGQIRISPRVVIRRATSRHPGVFRRFQSQWDSLNGTSTSSSPAASITTGGIWAAQNRSSSSTGPNSSMNNDQTRQYNTDMDCD